MRMAWRLVWVAAAGCTVAAAQDATGHAGQSTKCTVAAVPEPSEADKLRVDGHFAEAEALYLKMPPSPVRTAGLVRSEMNGRKLDEALALVLKELAAKPNDPLLLDLLGEVRFRRGEPDEAAVAYNRSLTLDGCAGRTRYDIARYLDLNGMYASAQTQLELAHKLAPGDLVITREWDGTQRAPLTADERIARLKQRETNDTS